MVYQEIMPQALALMTDVFGNYVIQKVSFSSFLCSVVRFYLVYLFYTSGNWCFYTVFRAWASIPEAGTGQQAFWSCSDTKSSNVWLSGDPKGTSILMNDDILLLPC